MSAAPYRQLFLGSALALWFLCETSHHVQAETTIVQHEVRVLDQDGDAHQADEFSSWNQIPVENTKNQTQPQPQHGEGSLAEEEQSDSADIEAEENPIEAED